MLLHKRQVHLPESQPSKILNPLTLMYCISSCSIRFWQQLPIRLLRNLSPSQICHLLCNLQMHALRASGKEHPTSRCALTKKWHCTDTGGKSVKLPCSQMKAPPAMRCICTCSDSERKFMPLLFPRGSQHIQLNVYKCNFIGEYVFGVPTSYKRLFLQVHRCIQDYS